MLFRSAAEMGLAAYGHVVEARRFGVAVTARLDEIEGITVLSPAKVTDISLGDGVNSLSLETNDGAITLEARLVVAADGANSFVRKHLKIPTTTRDYGQTAVICNVTPEKPHQGQAFECLTETGPFAILPHTGKRCGLVWSTNSDNANELVEMDDERFLSLAQERFGDRLGDFIRLGRRSAYPLKLTRAEQDVRDRLVLLGNAAHAIHPIGAQGFNLALRDVAVLAEILADGGGDPGEGGLLHNYSRWRRSDQRGTIANSDGMTRLYANPSVLAAALRTTGLIAHAILPSLRQIGRAHV